MENEWLEVAYINLDKAILHGQVTVSEQHDSFHMLSEKQIEQVLTKSQMTMIEDLNYKHEREMKSLLRSFID